MMSASSSRHRWVADTDGTYGYRRIHADLQRAGRPCDPQTVRVLMAECGLVACQPRPRGPRTTIPAASGALPDLVNRDFTADEPGLKLVGDITYIPTWQGWVYLATVLDCCTKKVVGYAMAEHMRTELVVDALKMAISNGHTRHGETVFHSDRGTQYMSAEFAEFTRDAGIVRSVGRTGICYDNAWAESFNATLKVERVHRTVYPTRRHAIGDTWYLTVKSPRNGRPYLRYFSPRKQGLAGPGFEAGGVGCLPCDVLFETGCLSACESGELLLDLGDASLHCDGFEGGLVGG